MSNSNEAFIKSFRDSIFQLRQNPSQCKEAVELLKVHSKYQELDEMLLYEYAIVAFYADENIDDIIVKVLNNKNCRISDCLSNYKFYNTTLIHNKKYEYTNKEGNYYSSTPSIILCPEFMKDDFKGAKYLMNQRFVNYKIVDGNKYMYEQEPRHPLTFNRRLLLNDKFEIIDNIKLKGNLEDVRLFEHQGKIYFSSSFLGHRDGQWGVSICTGNYPVQKSIEDITLDFDLNSTVKNENVEKNWVYVRYNKPDELEEQLYLIYQWYPLIIGKINYSSGSSSSNSADATTDADALDDATANKDKKQKLNKIKIAGNEYGKEEMRNVYNLDFVDSVEMPFFFKNARGSTNSFCYLGENWFIVHIVSYEVPRHYYNVIAIFDNEMNLLRYSYPFKLSKEPIEYALGLIVSNEEVIISYSTWDNTSNIAVYSKEYIDSIIRYE